MKRRSSLSSVQTQHEKAKDFLAEVRAGIEQEGFRFVQESFSHKVQETVREELANLLKPKDYRVMNDEWLRLHIAFRLRLKKTIIASTLKAISAAADHEIAKRNARIVNVSISDVVEEVVRRKQEAFDLARIKIEDEDVEVMDELLALIDQVSYE